jgi:hypothetical protein
MVMLEGFIDDSGSEPRSPHFVLAGFVSTAERWASFADAWEAECAAAPKIDDFKMAHANALRGDFRGQSRDESAARVIKLAGIVADHTMLRVQTVIRWNDYIAVMRPIALAKPLNDPYFALFYKVIMAVATWQDAQGLPGTTDFVFDEQSAMGTRAADCYDLLRSVATPTMFRRLGSKPIFRHDVDLLPLKAADMLAWQLRRAFAYPDESRPSSAMRILMKVPVIERTLSRADLEELAVALASS